MAARQRVCVRCTVALITRRHAGLGVQQANETIRAHAGVKVGIDVRKCRHGRAPTWLACIDAASKIRAAMCAGN